MSYSRVRFNRGVPEADPGPPPNILLQQDDLEYQTRVYDTDLDLGMPRHDEQRVSFSSAGQTYFVTGVCDLRPPLSRRAAVITMTRRPNIVVWKAFMYSYYRNILLNFDQGFQVFHDDNTGMIYLYFPGAQTITAYAPDNLESREDRTLTLDQLNLKWRMIDEEDLAMGGPPSTPPTSEAYLEQFVEEFERPEEDLQNFVYDTHGDWQAYPNENFGNTRFAPVLMAFDSKSEIRSPVWVRTLGPEMFYTNPKLQHVIRTSASTVLEHPSLYVETPAMNHLKFAIDPDTHRIYAVQVTYLTPTTTYQDNIESYSDAEILFEFDGATGDILGARRMSLVRQPLTFGDRMSLAEERSLYEEQHEWVELTFDYYNQWICGAYRYYSSQLAATIFSPLTYVVAFSLRGTNPEDRTVDVRDLPQSPLYYNGYLGNYLSKQFRYNFPFVALEPDGVWFAIPRANYLVFLPNERNPRRGFHQEAVFEFAQDATAENWLHIRNMERWYMMFYNHYTRCLCVLCGRNILASFNIDRLHGYANDRYEEYWESSLDVPELPIVLSQLTARSKTAMRTLFAIRTFKKVTKGVPNNVMLRIAEFLDRA